MDNHTQKIEELKNKISAIESKIKKASRGDKLIDQKNKYKLQKKLIKALTDMKVLETELDLKMLIGFAYFYKQKNFSEKFVKMTLQQYDTYIKCRKKQ